VRLGHGFAGREVAVNAVQPPVAVVAVPVAKASEIFQLAQQSGNGFQGGFLYVLYGGR